MHNASVLTRAHAGLDAPDVTVEVHLSPGLPAFNVVGLPESTVREARERVRSALLMSHFTWPDHRITVNLAPADLPKRGGRFDLPIALGLLTASGQLPGFATADREFYGELALDGRIRPARGLLAAVHAATCADRPCAVPAVNADHLARVPGSMIFAADNLLSLCAQLKAEPPNYHVPQQIAPTADRAPDLSDVSGQPAARRALEIAASGGHHLLMTGPPGAGKTLLATCLPGILPESSLAERLETWVVADLLGLPLSDRRPFRAPHHSASAVSLIGGGTAAAPGEITFAHGGVLFLDELPEFPRHVLDTLRQPLESGTVTISRAQAKHQYPAQFQLIAAMNPCPCGYRNTQDTPCKCSMEQIHRYQARVSGPLLDRIDIHIALARQSSLDALGGAEPSESTAVVRERVSAARERQLHRQLTCNARLLGADLLRHCTPGKHDQLWFRQHCDQLKLSSRGIHRSLRVARTIADMAAEDTVQRSHLLEALGYRESG